MRLEEGAKAIAIELPSIDGRIVKTEELLGKSYLLSFYRFATCPFCNLRIHEMTRRIDELGKDFQVIAIFESPISHLKQHMEGHHASFPILSDPKNKYYKKYGIEHSVVGMLKGMFFRMPTLIRGMLKGHFPYVIKGSIIKMPADFLIGKDGLIKRAYYASDEGDHLSFEEIKAFSLE